MSDIRPVMLFHRRFLSYTGGHGKVWDYFNHVMSSGLYQSNIFVSEDSLNDERNPWVAVKELWVPHWQPAAANVLFVAGMDWAEVPEDLPPHLPVINLIQHVRHADPSQPLFQFLSRKAIRICVSQAVAEAILATGRVNGPIFVIPNGIDVTSLKNHHTRSNHIFVGGLKNPKLAEQVAQQIGAAGRSVDLLIDKIPRSAYLSRLASASVAVLLPNITEGFYLPGLEAMALETPVVMTECIGSREYAVSGKNCVMVDASSLAEVALGLDGAVSEKYRLAGLETAKSHTLTGEYGRFLPILAQIQALWNVQRGVLIK